jgi:predicted nuclease of predicted toxin-antitoxin system
VKLKLDENLSRHLQPALAAFGHDVTTAAQEGLLSQPDAAMAAAASKEGRILLTLDVEFGDLRKYPPGSHPGILLFRPRSFGPAAVNHLVVEFVRAADLEELRGCVAIIDPERMRVRQPQRRETGE